MLGRSLRDHFRRFQSKALVQCYSGKNSREHIRAVKSKSAANVNFHGQKGENNMGVNDWKCSNCGASNFGKRSLCFTCSKARSEGNDGSPRLASVKSAAQQDTNTNNFKLTNKNSSTVTAPSFPRRQYVTPGTNDDNDSISDLPNRPNRKERRKNKKMATMKNANVPAGSAAAFPASTGGSNIEEMVKWSKGRLVRDNASTDTYTDRSTDRKTQTTSVKQKRSSPKDQYRSEDGNNDFSSRSVQQKQVDSALAGMGFLPREDDSVEEEDYDDGNSSVDEYGEYERSITDWDKVAKNDTTLERKKIRGGMSEIEKLSTKLTNAELVAKKAKEISLAKAKRYSRDGNVVFKRLLAKCQYTGDYSIALDIAETQVSDAKLIDTKLMATILHVLAKSNKIERARELLTQIGGSTNSNISHLKPTVYHYGAAMAGCGEYGLWEESLSLLNEMIERNIAPNMYVYSSVMAACTKAGKTEKSLQVLEAMKVSELPPDTTMYNCAIQACQKAQKHVEALQLFDKMDEDNVQRDAASYSSAISACGHLKDWQRAVQLLQESKKENKKAVRMNAILYTSVLTACVKSQQVSKVLELFDEMCGISYIKVDSAAFSVVLQACSLGGCVANASTGIPKYGDLAWMYLEEMTNSRQLIPSAAAITYAIQALDNDIWRDGASAASSDESISDEDAVKASTRGQHSASCVARIEELYAYGIEKEIFESFDIDESDSSNSRRFDLRYISRVDAVRRAAVRHLFQKMFLAYGQVSPVVQGIEASDTKDVSTATPTADSSVVPTVTPTADPKPIDSVQQFLFVVGDNSAYSKLVSECMEQLPPRGHLKAKPLQGGNVLSLSKNRFLSWTSALSSLVQPQDSSQD